LGTKFKEATRELKSTIPRADKYKYRRFDKSNPITTSCLSEPLIIGFETSDNKKASSGDNIGVKRRTFA